ncbi:MAG: hypothetical protein QOH10_86 [Actinomycetota bacterium]|nr:hypothetical protein [Actinomycetota bacterium]
MKPANVKPANVRSSIVNLRRIAVTLVAASLLVLVAAAPAGAVPPQPVDASEQGGLAFVLFAIMCGLFAASLFFMDRVRRRRSGED